ncbi:hypothetical protein [Alteribacillus iranensis]|uniref:Uncharacterized protein n=1 Tax=Alteribacillus iranensis TaxID=930128 RepID=A0A1I2BYS3_9BACI|nr:hypothetical protein [Alteribacillus iranensis]SFE60613.1 hypothetical protein SAMN05192532_102555 [Alteribacillus iranensis]
METQENERAMRLQSMLQDALQPMVEKIDTLEKEVMALREGQQQLKDIAEKKAND